GTAGAVAPFLSPDGERVGFFSGGLLKTTAVSSGPVVVVATGLDPLDGAAWGPADAIYAAGTGFDALVRVPATGGTSPEPFTTLDSDAGETWHRWPDPLPNGRGVLLTAGFASLAGSTSWVAVADARTGQHKLLVEGLYGRYSPSGHLLYATADRALMVAPFDAAALELTGPPWAVVGNLRVGVRGRVEFAVSASGTLAYATGPGPETRDLAWVTRDGTVEEVDPDWRANFGYPTLSPDGSRLAVVISEPGGADIWIQELDGGARLKLTVEGGVNGYPAWTPDGASVTYFRNTSETVELWTKPADGSGPPALELTRPRDLAESLWSPDGSWLIYRTTNVPSAASPGAGDILVFRPGGDGEPVPLATTPYPEVAPALSPDGRWLA
ncbi:MAG: hypothetical protein OEO23_09100, partial [Gemmatimonadota bacterium]|nr:hypothetical protein [Gemmatimonadota bacterium]